jgi:hypothetical protein
MGGKYGISVTHRTKTVDVVKHRNLKNMDGENKKA